MLYLTNHRFSEQTSDYKQFLFHAQSVYNWQDFSTDTRKLFEACFQDFFGKISFLFNKESFIDSIKLETVKSLTKQLIKELISAIGFQNVASHLLQCDRHYKSRKHCDRCTRVICRNSKITQILSQLECMDLKALMLNSYKDFREVLRVFNCPQTFPEFTIDCFIDNSKINPGVVSSGKKALVILLRLAPIIQRYFLII